MSSRATGTGRCVSETSWSGARTNAQRLASPRALGWASRKPPRAWLPVTRSRVTTKLVARDGFAVDQTSSAASGRTEFERTAVVVVARADAGVRCVGIVSSASALDVGSGLAEDAGAGGVDRR